MGKKGLTLAALLCAAAMTLGSVSAFAAGTSPDTGGGTSAISEYVQDDVTQGTDASNNDSANGDSTKNDSTSGTGDAEEVLVQETDGRSGLETQEATVAEEEGYVTIQSTPADFVTLLYSKFLGRDASAGEIQAWQTSQGAAMAAGIAFSQEALARTPADDGDFVRLLYDALLGRDCSQSEVDAWVSSLSEGQTRKKVFEGIVNSGEFSNRCAGYGVTAGSWVSDVYSDAYVNITAYVTRLYKICLGRMPEASGLEAWVRALVNGTETAAGAAWGFLDSTEFKNSGADYIEKLYEALLNRTPDSEGRANWTDVLNNGGVSRKYVASGFFGSQEFIGLCSSYGMAAGNVALNQARDIWPQISRYVLNFYRNCLGRDAGEGELNSMVSSLAGGWTGYEFACTIMLSDEYIARGRDSAAFTSDLYASALMRGMDSSASGWVTKLDTGTPRRSVILSIYQSSEGAGNCTSRGFAAVRNGFVTINGVLYYYSNGETVRGWQTLNGSRYYFDDGTGAAYTGWHYISGYKFYFDGSGVWQTDLDGILGQQSSYELRLNTEACVVTAYAKDGANGYIIPVKAFVCSPGASSTPTNIGTHYTLEKQRWHELMGPCWGQWTTLINSSREWFHSVMYSSAGDNMTLSVSAYNNLGSAVSHGCCRMRAGDAKWIYDNCSVGTKVVVYRSSDPGPYGKPTADKLSSWHTWDPTDPTAYWKCQQIGCH